MNYETTSVGFSTDLSVSVTRKTIKEGKVPRTVKNDRTVLYFGLVKLLRE